jgi:hypothetical protein
MKTPPNPPTDLSDERLIAEVQRLAGCERQATAELLLFLMELDRRRLYLGEGYPSLFAYCTLVLHYPEHAALNRIEVARVARRFPVLLEHIAEGVLHLTGARLLGPHLTDENAGVLLETARHKSKREIEELIAALRPKPPVASVVRRLPTRPLPSHTTASDTSQEGFSSKRQSEEPPVAATTVTSPVTRPVVAPLAPERYKVQFTITRETRDKLRKVQDLLRHVIPDGDPAAIFDRALTRLLEDVERSRFALTSRPRERGSAPARSRHIPAAVRREVWRRDDGRCAFVGSRGRCAERGFLEFHHVVPFAVGGAATVENIELRCAAHNGHEASLFFASETGDVVRERAFGWAD